MTRANRSSDVVITVTVRFPKLWLPALQRRNHVVCGENDDENGRKGKKKSLRKMVCAVFSNVFGDKKSSSSNGGDDQKTVVATGLGISKSRRFNEMLEDEEEVEGKERGKQREKFWKFFSKRTSGFVGDSAGYSRVADIVKTGRKQGKLKIAWPVKKMRKGKTEKHELCKKRILMGVKCKPLCRVLYDENGLLLPEFIIL